ADRRVEVDGPDRLRAAPQAVLALLDLGLRDELDAGALEHREPCRALAAAPAERGPTEPTEPAPHRVEEVAEPLDLRASHPVVLGVLAAWISSRRAAMKATASSNSGQMPSSCGRSTWSTTSRVLGSAARQMRRAARPSGTKNCSTVLSMLPK